MKKIQGSCLCGAIRYQSTSEPARTVACNCRHCQKQDGSTVSISVGVPANALKIQGLMPSVYEDIKESGSVVLRSFCPECGSSLFSESESEPNLIFVKAATLDDSSWIQPQIVQDTPRHRQISKPVTRHLQLAQVLEWPSQEKEWKVS